MALASDGLRSVQLCYAELCNAELHNAELQLPQKCSSVFTQLPRSQQPWSEDCPAFRYWSPDRTGQAQTTIREKLRRMSLR